MVLFCREHKKGSITLTLHVQPRAKKTELVGVHGDALKIKVAAPPVDGAANDEIVKFLAKFFGVAKSKVQLKHGDSSRTKVVEIEGVTTAELTQLLLIKGLITISLG